MQNDSTRDIAVAADTKIDSHLEDCFQVRTRIEKALDDLRADIKRINWYLPRIIGGIVVASHGIDIIISILGYGK